MLKLFLSNGNFRNFLLFQGLAGIGNGIFRIFMMWAVHAQYGNPLYTGIAGFMFVAPFVAGFLAGPFVDRRNKASLLRVTCLASLCVVALLLLVPYAHRPGVWFLLLAILVFSIADVFAGPARTALLPKIVGDDELIKANALISISATIAGLCIGFGLYVMMARGAGFELVYGANAAVMAAALVFSIFVRDKGHEKPGAKAGADARRAYISELGQALAFVRRGVMLRVLLALVFMSLFGQIAYVNVPEFAEAHMGTASGYIVLSALALVGGIIGSYIIRIVGPKLALSKILVVGFVAAGVARILFVNVIATDVSRAIWIYVLYVGLGGALGILIHTLQQKLSPKNMIGRVGAITTSITSAAAALGALLGGVAGTLLPSVDMALVIQGASSIAIGAFLLMSRSMRELPKMDDVKRAEG